VIFIFDDEGRGWFSAKNPQHLSKVHYLGALDPARPLQIPDPYGGQLATFVENYTRIQYLLLSPRNRDGNSPQP